MEQETVELKEQIIHGQDGKPQNLSLTKEWNEEREHVKLRFRSLKSSFFWCI